MTLRLCPVVCLLAACHGGAAAPAAPAPPAPEAPRPPLVLRVYARAVVLPGE